MSTFVLINCLVIAGLVILLAVLLFLNHRYRVRKRRMLYRLATGKTAFEGPKDDEPELSAEASDIPQEEEKPAVEEVEAKPELSAEEREALEKKIADAKEELWIRLEKYMEEKKPYTDPDFDRKSLAKDMYSNISYVSGAINAHGKSFTTWLAEYRVKMAIEILQHNPKITVRDLCVKVGVLNPVVFNRQFRGVTGMSVSEFRSQIGQ